jgi:hypothetical protein
MMIQHLQIRALALILLTAPLCGQSAPVADPPFKQAVSIKYQNSAALKDVILQKVVVDYNDNPIVLTSDGVYRTQDQQLVKDLLYSPLAQRKPRDIAIQEGSGYLYYLYQDKWLTNAHAGIPYGRVPENKYDRLAVAADGQVLLVGKTGAAICQNGEIKEVAGFPAAPVLDLQVSKGIFYVLTVSGVYQLQQGAFLPLHQGKALQAMTIRSKDIVLGTPDGYYTIDKISGKSILPLQEKLPVTNIRCLTAFGEQLWAGTPNGAFAAEKNSGYRYYASRRWLDDNNVNSIAVDSKGDCYVLSTTGLNQIHFQQYTLLDKANLFQQGIRDRHIRYGLISNVTLATPGDLATAQMTDTDNDGLWTAFYLGSQAFRYAVTKDKTARRYAWEAFEAYERLVSINPLKGFPSRTFERKGFKVSDPERWHDSQDPEWEWKGTTSSDEFCGYIFIVSLMDQLVVENPQEKQRVANFIDKILTHIIDNNYYFVDADGKPTLWGRWNPEYINSFPESVEDRKLGSAHILAGLQLGYALTGKQRYKDEAMKLINQYGYLKNMLVPYAKIHETPGTIRMGIDLGIGGWNHSDDEMAFLTYWPLYRYAFDKNLQAQYKKVILDHWQIEKPERNALWNLITLGTIGVYDAPSVQWHLQEYPVDLVRWSVHNSHRKDIELLPENFRKQTTKVLLPPGERPMNRHNANAFELDGGENGRSELAGDEYLLPYWLGRYLKVIQ